ncbi:hypothetical protein EOL96_09760, partial [Candidatus Saccharibacteria bacterium]|nr:hypothetical protein [Candidatus Saccharibacteria bacterium]
MDMGWVIQVVIYANVFLVGVVLTLAVQSWRAHRSGKNQNVGIEALPQSVRDEVIDHARTHYQRAIYRSAVQLDKNLAATATKLNESLVSLRDAVSEGEMSQYNEVLNTIRRQAANIVGATSEQISAHQKELRKHFEDHQAALDLELQKAENATELQLQQHQQDYQKRQADMEAQLLEHQKQLEA